MAKKTKQEEELLEDDDDLLDDEDLDDDDLDDELEDDDDDLEDDEDDDDDLEDDEDDDSDEDEDDDDLDEDDEDEDDEDDDSDEDEDDDDLDDEDDEDDDEDEEKSAPKKKASAPAKSTKKADPKKKASAPKKETKTKKSTKKKAEKKAPQYSLDELNKGFEEKSTNYKTVMDKRSKAKTAKAKIKAGIPARTVSKDDFNKFICANTDRFTPVLSKILTRVGMDKEEVTAALENFQLKKTEANTLVQGVFDTVYDIMKHELTLQIFKSDECEFQMIGDITEEKITDNSHLNVDDKKNHTKVGSFLRITGKSPAPVVVKQKGTMVKGKFKPAK